MQPSTRNSEQTLIQLVYELLDAHEDTAQLARAVTGEGEWRSQVLQWQAHLDYLRCLQRRSRELIATVDES